MTKLEASKKMAFLDFFGIEAIRKGRKSSSPLVRMGLVAGILASDLL